MNGRHRSGGFSLIEVVIAIAIVAGGVTVILGLLPMLAQKTSDSADTHTALRLVDGVKAQLIVESDGGFNALVGAIPILQPDPDTGLRYVADRNGSDVRKASTANDEKGQFFLIVVRKYGTGPLSYDNQGVLLNVNVVVSWPYRLPSVNGLTNALPAADRRSVTYNLALHR